VKLYEIAEEYEALIAAIEDGDIPEEAVADTLESIQSLLVDKADNIACLVKSLSAEASAIKAEEDALSKRRKQKERMVQRLKSYLSDVLLRSGYTKLETARSKISFRKSEGVVIDNEDAFIVWAESHDKSLLTYPSPTISKTAVKEALGEGVEIVGVRIEAKQNIQIK
jgi:hypothetical protein